MTIIHTPPDPTVLRFVQEVLSTGVVWSDVLSGLIGAAEGEPWPGEDPAAVLVEMSAGSARVGLRGVPAKEIERATELIIRARERMVEDLRMAAELARRREGGARAA